MGLEEYRGRIILVSIIIILLWLIFVSFLAVPFSALPFYVQFFAIAIFSYMLPSIIRGINHQEPLQKILADFFFILAADLVIPPLLVNLSGQINDTVFLGGGVVDVFFSKIYQSFGIEGWFLFVLTYAVTFVMLITLSVILDTDENILKAMWDEVRGSG